MFVSITVKVNTLIRFFPPLLSFYLGVKGNGVAGAPLQIPGLHDGMDADVVLRVGAQVHQVAVLARPAEDGPILALLALVAHQHLVEIISNFRVDLFPRSV